MQVRLREEANPTPNPTPNPDQVSWSVYYKAANELDSLDGTP